MVVDILRWQDTNLLHYIVLKYISSLPEKKEKFLRREQIRVVDGAESALMIGETRKV